MESVLIGQSSTLEEMSEPERKEELVFVHGSLRRGGPDASRMEGAEFVESGDIEGVL